MMPYPGMVEEYPRWCPDCEALKTFEVDEITECGKLGWCLGCEERKGRPFQKEERLLIRFERTNSEAEA